MKGVLKHIYELHYFNESLQIHFFTLNELLDPSITTLYS